MNGYTCVKGETRCEKVIERSRFLSACKKTETEEEAREFLESVKKEHPFATHNCYAFVAEQGKIARYSDDGEPTGTAGMPTLDTIRKSGVDDTCVVVTRYFGGILLGAGGLVRAYSKAASLAVQAAGIVTYESFSELSVRLTYPDYQKIQNELPRFGAHIDGTDFTDSVLLRFAVKDEVADGAIKRFSELTAGRAVPHITGHRLDK